MLNRLISIAPMMGYTDRHFRMLMRVITPHALLYTEMVTTHELLKGRYPQRVLHIHAEEHPIALQLGGSEPEDFARCAVLAANSGFDEVNLNIGCPSDRVQKGRFGACLMKEPQRVADCVGAIKAVVDIPVTVKTRIGVDDCDGYQDLCHFIQTVASAGCEVFIIHARKAWLNGLSPRENRHIPPLCYPIVYQLKKDFPHLQIIVNGGIQSIEEIDRHLQVVDGVMLGRVAYQQPLLFAQLEQRYFNKACESLTPQLVLSRYAPYLDQQLAVGTKRSSIFRHLHGLYQGQPGAKRWRQYLHAANQSSDMTRFFDGSTNCHSQQLGSIYNSTIPMIFEEAK